MQESQFGAAVEEARDHQIAEFFLQVVPHLDR